MGSDEEYFITDYEANFKIDEYQNLAELNIFVRRYNELDEFDRVAVDFLLDQGNDFEYALMNYSDVDLYKGTYKELAESMVDEGLFGSIPESIAHYIDYDKIARDLEFDYHEFGEFIVRYA